MKTKVKKFGRRYPWDEWFARPKLVLRRGVDFACEPLSMAVMVRLRLADRQLIRTVRVKGDQVTVEPKSDWRGARKRGITYLPS